MVICPSDEGSCQCFFLNKTFKITVQFETEEMAK